MQKPIRGWFQPAPSSCPVRDRGIRLRTVCEECSGNPQCGQLTLQKRTPLYLEQDPATHVFAVVQGYLRETRTMSDGRVQSLRLVGPGELGGVEALLDRNYYTALEALTEAVVCRVSAETVRDTLRTRVDQPLAMVTELIAELDAVRESLHWVGTLDAEERVLAMLARLSGDTGRGVEFKLPLTRLEISELLGLAHETVSRVIQGLARRGTIRVRGRQITFL